MMSMIMCIEKGITAIKALIYELAGGCYYANIPLISEFNKNEIELAACQLASENYDNY